MADFLNDFISLFGLDSLFDGTTLTVQQTLGLMIIAFLGAIFLNMGARFVLEIIKILGDWRRFK